MKKNKIILLGAILSFLMGCSSGVDSATSSNSSSSSDKSETIVDSTVVVDDKEDTNENLNQEKYHKFHRNIKLYINPSVQYNNMYAGNMGNEGEHMNVISKLLENKFKSSTNIEVFTNNSMPGKSLYESVKESNALNVDYHLALHSNAGGGKGSEGFYSSTSYNFTKSIIDSLQNVLPYPTRGLKNGHGHLYEINKTLAMTTLIEILFHDDVSQAKFIISNYDIIAKAIFTGVINYFYVLDGNVSL